MSDTNPDIAAPTDDFIDVYVTASITVGTSLQVSNKGQYPILLYIQATKPTANSKDGEVLTTSGIYSRLTVDAAETGLWAKSLGKDQAIFSVQEA